MTSEKDIDERLSLIESVLTDMEGKIEELWSRPRMPYTQNASSGDRLALSTDSAGFLIPEWNAS